MHFISGSIRDTTNKKVVNNGDAHKRIPGSVLRRMDTNEPVITVQPATPSSQQQNLTPLQGDALAPFSPHSTLPIPGQKSSTSSLSSHNTEPKRRVSIVASDPMSEPRLGGYDNFGFEQNPKRKISQTSVHSHSEVGPVRRKSILVNHDNESIYSHGSAHSNDPRQNHRALNTTSAIDALHSRLQAVRSPERDGIEQSWIYALCLRCRQKDTYPSWEPPHWQKVCPYPLCPSFRQFARIISLVLIGVLIWITAFVIIGQSAAPGGQLFSLVVLTVASNFGGWLISLTTLPRLIGMLLVGILFQNVGWVSLEGDFKLVTVELRRFALTIILIRAGLEMEPAAFNKVYKTILKLGIIPWILECGVIAITSHFLLELPWIWAFLLGAIIAAVSPAVVVPCLYRLRSKGYGVAKGIPTLIIAVAGIDDALSVALFGIISSILFSENNLAYQISQAPICIIGGLAFGVLWGYMSRYIPENGDSYVVPLRTLMLFSGGCLAIFGSEKIGYEGAGPLACIFAAFVSNLFWCKDGWEVEDNPVSTAFEIFWMIFEPILFGITGTTVKINELDPDIVYVAIGCLIAGVVLRIICTAGIAFGDKLNKKEKVFVALSWMSKATVQAALGPVALNHIDHESPSAKENERYAHIVQTMAVLSIILTAPLGAILITVTGKKLLTKTKQPQVTEGWRRSHRPSLRDISIIAEVEEEREEDPEMPDDPEEKSNNLSILNSYPEDKTTGNNTNSNTHSASMNSNTNRTSLNHTLSNNK